MTQVHLKIEDGIATIEFNAPDRDVNILDSGAMKELEEILSAVRKTDGLRGVLVASAKDRIFIAGADIREIEGITAKEDALSKAEGGKRILKALEDLKVPTVAVINGACLGGGMELALACRFRVASFSDKIKIGLPEVQLGVLPGFGGTQRLPRRIGLVKALPLMLSGKILSGKDALRLGVVDRLFPEKTLREDALAFMRAQEAGTAKSSKKPPRSWFLESTPIGRALVFRTAKKDVMKQSRGFYPAPLQILKLIQKTFGGDPARGFRLESEAFADLAVTKISKNLIRLFFMNEQYKKMAWTSLRLKAGLIQQCGVIGAGVMGGGIAHLISDRKMQVRVKDIHPDALGGTLKEARRLYDESIQRRKLKDNERDYKMGLISVGLTNQGMRRSGIIIEAVVEDLKIKQKVFAELDGITPASTILASNTSSLSVTKMASVTKHPERVVGLHFFNPVNRMPLVEVVKAEQTSEEVMERAVQFARGLGKIVIVVKDVPGFLVNRLLMPYLNEAAYLMEDGMTADAIDKAATDFGMPMGPMELVDYIGIDIAYKVAHILEEGYGARMKAASLLQKVKEDGLVGKKAGRGFYLYQGKKKIPNPAVRWPGGQAGVPSAETALKRMIYVMVNEAARCLEEGVVPEPGAVDIGMIMGTGFPPFRAGLLHYADSIGLENIAGDLERFAKRVNQERFSPSAYLLKLAKSRQTFHGKA